MSSGIKLEDLKRIKEQAAESLKVREAGDKPRVVIGMGTCGIAAGAREVMTALLDELEKRKLTNVTVGQTGCLGLCAQEPLLEVTLPGQKRVTYGNVTSSMVRQIVAQHLVNGSPVVEWAINVESR